MKFLGFMPLLAYAWDLDLRVPDAPSSVYLEPGEEFTVIVGGSAGTGGQWMHYEPNPDTFTYVDNKYTYEAPEGMTGGPFKSEMNFKAGNNEGTTELRLAYTRSWEFDSEVLKTEPYDTWSKKVWNSNLL